MLAVLLPASASAEPTTRIIVKRDPGLSAGEQRDIRADAGVRHVENLPLPRTEVVAAPAGDAKVALRELNADPDVAYAELDHRISVSGPPPNDPDFDIQWGLENDGNVLVGSDPGVADADMDITDAWLLSTGTGRTVAVVDTGVDGDHPDLRDHVVPGWDFVDSDPYPTDPNSHGTHVAGIIAATRNNSVGIAGVAPDTRILPLRALGANGQGHVSDAIAAYAFAADHGASIVNLSFGSTDFTQAEKDMIGNHPETLFVAAAGNEGRDNDVVPTYPCAYDLANILCVGASRHDDKPAAFSNYGETSVDVFAPGFGIWSTLPGGGYGAKSGTSMAAPMVAGGAALLLSGIPTLTPPEVTDAFVHNGNPGDPTLVDKSVSDGRINVDDALRNDDADGDGTAEIDDNCPGVANPGQADTDGDGVGDLCAAPDADPDHDSVVGAADHCPNETAAYASDGCPGTGPNSDTDDWPDAFDACATQNGTARGCPDADSDSVRDALDNCPSVANASQANLDGDAFGDACDGDRDGDGVTNGADGCPDYHAATATGCPVAAPVDSDGDGTYNPSDACPYEYAKTVNGCPVPTVTSLSARAKKRHGTRSATISVRSSRAATVQVTVEIRKCKHGRHCRWTRVTRKTTATVADRATITATRLKTGRYRAVVVLSSTAGRAKAETESFRVR
jgi:hypothetical protein